MPTADQNIVTWGQGVAFVGGEKLPELQEIGFNFGLNSITMPKGDGGGDIDVNIGQPISGRVVIGGMSPQLMAVLTGGANATGTLLRKRNTTLTKSTNDLTIADSTYDIDTLEVTPAGANKAPLKKVASSPSVGEYSVSTVTVSLNASQSEDDFIVDYMYTDASNGLTTTIDPTDLPSEFRLVGSIRSKDLFPGTQGDLIIDAAKVIRTSELTLGGASSDFSKPGFDFKIRNDSSGDLKIYWQA